MYVPPERVFATSRTRILGGGGCFLLTALRYFTAVRLYIPMRGFPENRVLVCVRLEGRATGGGVGVSWGLDVCGRGARVQRRDGSTDDKAL